MQPRWLSTSFTRASVTSHRAEWKHQKQKISCVVLEAERSKTGAGRCFFLKVVREFSAQISSDI